MVRETAEPVLCVKEQKLMAEQGEVKKTNKQTGSATCAKTQMLKSWNKTFPSVV